MTTKPDKLWWFLIPYALVYGFVLLSMNGVRAYEPSPFHRYQAEALLHGHLYLADSIDSLQSGLVWHAGYVQHVWGLGIGIWLLPWTALWRLVSNSPCPDGVALGLAFALLAYFSGNTGLKLIKDGQRAFGIGVMWLIALCPALWTLARADDLVFEETVLYALILSLAILVALVRVSLFRKRSDYFLCCALSAFAVWIRPTHAVYGLAALVVASWVMWQQYRGWKEIILGFSTWVASLSLLAWTNHVRFGSAGEFGHHLTVSSTSMMYLTRFGNPYGEAGFIPALKELFGLLFLANPEGANAFSDNLFSGQSEFPRWRRLDMTAFDLGYGLVMLSAIILATVWIIRRQKRHACSLYPALLLWASFSTPVLAMFYLHYPAVASRYLLDFAPAFTGFALLLWVLLPSTWIKYPLLAGWLVYEIAAAKVSTPEPHSPTPIQLALPHHPGMQVSEFNGNYTLDHHPSLTSIAGNGHGWRRDGGFAEPVVSVAVDAPRFVEFHVSRRRSFNGDTPRPDIYRAQIDGVTLSLLEQTPEPDGFKVRFDVPKNLRRPGAVILFLCFSKEFDAEDQTSERYLYSLRWR